MSERGNPTLSLQETFKREPLKVTSLGGRRERLGGAGGGGRGGKGERGGREEKERGEGKREM